MNNNLPDETSVTDIVRRYDQSHVFKWWNELDIDGQQRLMRQLKEIDFQLMHCLIERIHSIDKKERFIMESVEAIYLPKNEVERHIVQKIRNTGEKIIRAGKLCVFVVAGGQGSRLDFNGPKGCFPIGPISGKSIFQWHAEKILAAERRYESIIPWYIMTAESNDEATRDFFQAYEYFGLSPSNIMFFKQKMLPALDVNGKLILDEKDHIFTSPNGHGGAFLAMVEAGAIDDMKRRGISVISYFQVDNVLINMVDPVFIGYHVNAKAEMSSKMLKKRNPEEKLGHFGLVDQKLHVIEYSDMSEEDKQARTRDGRLKYEAGSIAIHLIDPDFVIQETKNGLRLPYHMAIKKIPYLNSEGIRIQPDTPNGYKFETFIFDALKDTTRSIILEVKREHEFSPVKNKSGEDSPETAKRDISNFFGEWFEAAGIAVPRNELGDVQGTIEISPLFADSKERFIEKMPSHLSFKGSLYLGPT